MNIIAAIIGTVTGASVVSAVYFALEARAWSRAFRTLALQRLDDLAEAAATYAAMEREIKTLRFCANVGAFHDGEMDAAQADAFRVHLTRCERCQERLVGLVQEHARLSTGRT